MKEALKTIITVTLFVALIPIWLPIMLLAIGPRELKNIMIGETKWFT